MGRPERQPGTLGSGCLNAAMILKARATSGTVRAGSRSMTRDGLSSPTSAPTWAKGHPERRSTGGTTTLAIRKQTAGGPPQSSKPTTADPLNVNARLYAQIARLLDQLEAEDVEGGITIPQRINALIAVGRVQIMFASLRKLANADTSTAGSEVRRFASAFATRNGTGGRESDSRGPEPFELDSDSDDDGPDSPDAA